MLDIFDMPDMLVRFREFLHSIHTNTLQNTTNISAVGWTEEKSCCLIPNGIREWYKTPRWLWLIGIVTGRKDPDCVLLRHTAKHNARYADMFCPSGVETRDGVLLGKGICSKKILGGWTGQVARWFWKSAEWGGIVFRGSFKIYIIELAVNLAVGWVVQCKKVHWRFSKTAFKGRSKFVWIFYCDYHYSYIRDHTWWH